MILTRLLSRANSQKCLRHGRWRHGTSQLVRAVQQNSGDGSNAARGGWS